MATVFVLWTSWLVLMALDAVRFGWSQMPVWAQAVGAILIALCMYVACLTFRENSDAAPVVKIARERGHRVVSSGPHAYVRHPMYAGALLFFIGTPLQLGSWYGLAAVPALIAVLAARGDGGTDAGGRTAGLPRLRHARALSAYSRTLVARADGTRSVPCGGALMRFSCAEVPHAWCSRTRAIAARSSSPPSRATRP